MEALGYIDDWLLHCFVQHLTIIIPVLAKHMAPIGLTLKLPKCAVWVPAVLREPIEQAQALGIGDLCVSHSAMQR